MFTSANDANEATARYADAAAAGTNFKSVSQDVAVLMPLR